MVHRLSFTASSNVGQEVCVYTYVAPNVSSLTCKYIRKVCPNFFHVFNSTFNTIACLQTKTYNINPIGNLTSKYTLYWTPSVNLTQRPHKKHHYLDYRWDDKSQVEHHARVIFANADKLDTIVLAPTDHVASVITVLEEIGAIRKTNTSQEALDIALDHGLM